MNVNITILPVLVAAVMATLVMALDSEPRFSNPGAENGKDSNLLHDSRNEAAALTAPETFKVALIGLAYEVPGDVSPVLFVTNRQFDFPPFEPAPEPEPVQQAMLVVEPVRTPLPALSTNIAAALEQCRQNPDRYNWKAYALAAGFPADVVNGEMEYVIQNESGGDLCARNPSSGAICWVQQISGEPKYLDPATCMAVGFAKWVDGGRDFHKHWYRWWN